MFESKINRGRANGYAPLDGSGKVPLDKLPPIQSTIDTGSLATTSSLQSLIDVTGSFATTGSNSFYGNQSISGSLVVSGSLVASSTFVNNSNLQLSGSDLIIDSGSLSVSGSINVSGSLNVTNTFVNRAIIDALNSDLIIEGGYLILTGSAVPTNLSGSDGDRKGMVVFDNDYLYYCTEDFGGGTWSGSAPHIYNAEPGNVWNSYEYNYLQLGPSQEGGGTFTPQAGWYFVDDNDNIIQLLSDTLWFSGGAPSPYTNGTGWLCVGSTSWVYNVSNPTITLYETMPVFVSGSDIWKRISLNPSSGSAANVADFTFTSQTIENDNITLDAVNTITLHAQNGDIILNPDGNTYLGSAGAGNWVVAGGYLESVIGDTNVVNNGTGHTITDNLTNIINSIPSIDQSVSTTSSVQFHDLTLDGTGSFQSDLTVYGNLKVWGTQSIINSTNVELSDNILYLAPSGGGDFDLGIVGHYNDGTYSHTGIFSDASDGHAWKVFKGLTSETTGAYVDTNGVGFTLADFKANNIYGGIYATNGVVSGSSQLTSSLDSRYLNTYGDSVISGSSQLTSSLDLRYATSASYLTSLNGAISSSTQVLGGSGIYSSSAQLPSGIVSGSSQVLGGSGIYSSSAQLPSGIVSGSSQLTSSFDTRYTLSGSVVSGTTPAGTISGSSQLTSSFDGRYTQTGSFNTLTASFNSFTASGQAVTTGSNSFNGTQTITGSLNITNGSIIASQITANTASLYLTSGSNLYVQNNGVVEITGSLNVSGSATLNVPVLYVGTGSGDEGGEINLAIPVTNTSLQNRVAVDIYQNRLRLFEGSVDAKGVNIDLSKAPLGASGELIWKVSGFVNAGTFLTLDNVKATLTSSGARGLSIGAVSTSFVGNIGGTFGYNAGVGGSSNNSVTYTTTATTSIFGWAFSAEGDMSTYILNDKTNSRVYRITLMLGGSYNNNFISIERLH